MRDKMIRSLTLAVAAVVGIGMVSSVGAQTVSEDTTLACGAKKRVSYCAPKRKAACVRRTTKRVAVMVPKTTSTTITTTKTIEKPIIIQPECEPAPVAAAPVVQEVIEQPAVVQQTPVIIDRYEKHHRSLLHLGLFPFNLLGE